jgi:hypothetical protein
LRRLYAQVDLLIPKEAGHSAGKGSINYVRPHVINVVRDFSIRNGLLDNRNPAYVRKQRVEVGKLDTLVHELVNQVPLNQLQAFS